MVAYLTHVWEVISKLKGLSITQILLEKNKQADLLARLASSSEQDLLVIRVKYLAKLSMSSSNGIEEDLINIGPSWIDPILMYLTIGNLLTKKIEARNVKFQATRYHVINGVLYNRGYTSPYL